MSWLGVDSSKPNSSKPNSHGEEVEWIGDEDLPLGYYYGSRRGQFEVMAVVAKQRTRGSTRC